MESNSIQVQTVLYGNDKKNILKSIYSFYDATLYAYNKGKVSRVTVFYGDAYDTPLFTQEEIDEVNNSTQDCFLLKYIFFNKNTGSARGQNVLAQSSFEDFLFIINPDLIVAKNIFVELLAPFKDTSVGITESKQLPVEHTKNYDKNTKETSWSMGACTFIKRKVFDFVSGYDSDNFFMYCDDVDLSWRVRIAGYKVLYVKEALCFHPKQLNLDAEVIATGFAVADSVKAALIIRHKYNREDLVEQSLSYYERQTDDSIKKGLQLYYECKNNNKLPFPIRNAGKIADFDSV